MPKGSISPRRLSRARPPPPPSHTNSVSSNSSNRAERSTRSHNKASSPQKSSTPQSLTSEDPSEEARAATSEPPQLRRSKRQLDNDEDGDTKIEDAGDDEIVEDEETTRCICGYQDYPGPPADPTIGRAVKTGHATNADEPADDRGGLFIQCDNCQVWQHGGCVSIMEESAVPDNYYCEECKPDLHELLKSSTGQKFSHYLPVWSKSHPKTSRKGSVDKDDKAKVVKDKDRLSRALPETKRRSTMNSRAAYDEDEVLRKVLEESKTEGPMSTENGSRKGKRIRDESEDFRLDIKRLRTTSSVLSSHSGEEESGGESDQEKGIKKPPRLAAPKGQKEKTPQERKDAAAVKRSSGRTERRRNGGGDVVEPSSILDPPEESSAAPSARPSAKASPVGDADTPDTPNLNPNTTITVTSSTTVSKRGGKRPGAGRGRSNPAPTPSERDEKDSPRNGTEGGGDTPVPSVTVNGTVPGKRGKRGQHSKDESGESDKDAANNANGVAGSDADIGTVESTAIVTTTHVVLSGTGASKKKEPSMNELKRRAAAMLEWVEKAKDDLGKSTVVGFMVGSSPGPGAAGSLSPQVKSELGSVADGLHSRLLGWQVEYGAG